MKYKGILPSPPPFFLLKKSLNLALKFVAKFAVRAGLPPLKIGAKFISRAKTTASTARPSAKPRKI